MKVLHVIPSISPRYGGPSQAVLGMCRALREHVEVEAEIATTDADGPAGRMTIEGSNPHRYRDVPVWLFPRTWSERWKYSRELGRWLDLHVREYDLVHVHGVFSYATRAACRSASRYGIPVAARPCGMLAPYSLRQSRAIKLPYWHLFEKHHLASARWFHAASPGERDDLEQVLPGRAVACIPLGLDDDAWEPPRRIGTFRARFGIPAKQPLLLYLSRLRRKKGLADLLLPVLAKLPEQVWLAVVGEEDPHDRGYVAVARDAANRLGVADRVIWTGPLYGADKWSAYDDADVYVLPSEHENFGITAIEALARGTPSVLSPGVQAGELLGELAGVRVAERDPQALVEAVQASLEFDDRQRVAFGQHARERARRDFSWEGTARVLADRYAATVSPSTFVPGPAR